MNSTDIWFDFMEKAHSILIKGQKINKYDSNIQLIIEPSFENHILLQLTWDNKDVYWYRTTWQKMADTKKFNDPIEKLKFIGKEAHPTISCENGTIELERIQKIIDQIEMISVKPQIKKWGGIILDGCFFTLIIGVENTQTIFKWHNLPDEWKDLEKLVNMLTELNRKLL